MSRLTLQRTAVGLVLIVGLAALAAGAPAPAPDKDPAPKTPPAKDDASAKRLLYMLKNGSAKDLATVLNEHFKGVAEIQALPDSTSNCLLISAAPAALDEVVKVLEQLDRRPQTVAVEILVAEVAAKKADSDKPGATEEVDEKDFTGTASDVEAKVQTLLKKGAIGALKRFQLTMVEGVPASITVGENKPYVSGMTLTRTGVAARNINYRNTGVKADATVRVSPEKVVTVDLKLEDSHAFVPEDGIPIGNDENGKPVLATEFATSNLACKMDVPSGKAQAAQGVKTVSKSGKTQAIVIVSARVIEPETKSEK